MSLEPVAISKQVKKNPLAAPTSTRYPVIALKPGLEFLPQAGGPAGRFRFPDVLVLFSLARARIPRFHRALGPQFYWRPVR
jgi:hypothetical protein